MSVAVTISTVQRAYPNPGSDPRLPMAIWYAGGGLIGDASGGVRTITIALNSAGSTRSGRSWSCETCYIRDTHSADQDATCHTQNLDSLGPGLTNPLEKGWGQILNSDGFATSPEGMTLARDLHPHLYLGAQSANTGDAGILIRLINRDAETMGVFLSGYIWGPQVINLGALKPVDGLLGG